MAPLSKLLAETSDAEEKYQRWTTEMDEINARCEANEATEAVAYRASKQAIEDEVTRELKKFVSFRGVTPEVLSAFQEQLHKTRRRQLDDLERNYAIKKEELQKASQDARLKHLLKLGLGFQNLVRSLPSRRWSTC